MFVTHDQDEAFEVADRVVVMNHGRIEQIAGLAIGGSIGFVLGLANGLSRRSERVLDTTVQMIRNIPHLALIPLVILWLASTRPPRSSW